MITYDETKRLSNLNKHGIDFLGCEEIFTNFTITREDTCDDYCELRLQTLGLWNGVVLFVVHSPRGEYDHIISIRKANKNEQRIYWKYFPN